MKIYYTIAILLVLSCSSAKKITNFNILNIRDTITDTIIPLNSKDMFLDSYKTYDTALVKKSYNHILRQEVLNDIAYFAAGDGRLFTSTFDSDSNNFENRYLFIIPSENAFYSFMYYYYPSGKLYKVHQFTGFNGSVAIGKWYTFDENGKVTEEIDQNKKFLNVNYDKVLRFMQSKGYINLKTGKNRDKVFFTYFEKSKVWKTTYFIGRNQNNHKEYIHYYIDAKTGDVLDTRNSIVHYNPMGLPFLKDEIYKEKYR